MAFRPAVREHLDMDHAVYAAASGYGSTLIGGADWDRRRVPFTTKLADESAGILRIFRHRGGKRSEIRSLRFGSMVYAIVPLPGKRFFVGCKNEKDAFNLVDRDGNHLKRADDASGQGIYNASYDARRHEIVAATRAGKLLAIDPETLKIKRSIQLTQPHRDSEGPVDRTLTHQTAIPRLWSLQVNPKDGTVYAGDYDGHLYAVPTDFEPDGLRTLDLTGLHPDDARTARLREKGFGPSLWGLELEKNGRRIVLGTRWGMLLTLDRDLNVRRRRMMDESISDLHRLGGNHMLVGTRSGMLLTLNLHTGRVRPLAHHPPALQRENAVWGMGPAGKGVWACFADGTVKKISRAPTRGGKR